MCENVKNERSIAIATLSELLTFVAFENTFNDFDFLFGNLMIDETGRIE